MKTLQYKSKDPSVHVLEEVLTALGYSVFVSDFFGMDTHKAVMDFQSKHQLVVDGKVGIKTWAKLAEAVQQTLKFTEKLLSENDLINFANTYQLELAAVKAVNEVESSCKGFLISGKAKILFEGHVFWQQLKNRGFNPKNLSNESNADVLYEKWTKKHYLGGEGEYTRLNKATSLLPDIKVKEAALCAASWGSFQIMGYHFENLGFSTVDAFVMAMNLHEREHLEAFGKFLEVTSFKSKKLMQWLKEKNWERFAEGYNGSGFKANKYDEKLEKAYLKYKNL